MVPPTKAALKNKTVEEHLEIWKEDCYISFSEKSYK